MSLWKCTTCQEEYELDLDTLKNNKTFRWQCSCGKDIILGTTVDGNGRVLAFTYKPGDPEAVADGLAKMLPYALLPVSVADEMIKHARFERWDDLKKLVGKYYNKLMRYQPLMELLTNNMIY